MKKQYIHNTTVCISWDIYSNSTDSFNSRAFLSRFETLFSWELDTGRLRREFIMCPPWFWIICILQITPYSRACKSDAYLIHYSVKPCWIWHVVKTEICYKIKFYHCYHPIFNVVLYFNECFTSHGVIVILVFSSIDTESNTDTMIVVTELL